VNTETLKINIVQQILNLSDTKILEQIKELLGSESIVGYEADGTAISKKQFLKDMVDVEKQLKSGMLKTYTTEEVRQRILGNK